MRYYMIYDLEENLEEILTARTRCDSSYSREQASRKTKEKNQSGRVHKHAKITAK